MGEREGKTEVIDLIINALKEHEKTLDETIGELKALEATMIQAIQETKRGAPEPAVVDCRSWNEFKQRGKGARAIVLQVQRTDVTVIALVGITIYRYILNLKKWLSEELNVPPENISEGIPENCLDRGGQGR